MPMLINYVLCFGVLVVNAIAEITSSSASTGSTLVSISKSIPPEIFSLNGLLDEQCVSGASFSSALIPEFFQGWEVLQACSHQVHLLPGETAEEMIINYAMVANTKCTGSETTCNPGLVQWSKNRRGEELEFESISLPAYSGGLHRLGMMQSPRSMAITSGRITKETSKYLLLKFNFGNPTTNIYQAPDLWNAKIGGLVSGDVVKYRVPGSPRFYEFVVGGRPSFQHQKITPIHSNEIRIQKPVVTIGLAADVGQTSASNATLQGLKMLDAAAILLAGDLSYADGFLYAWDRFGILLEASYGPSVPTISCPGDHEVWFGEQFVQYAARYEPLGRGYHSHDVADFVHVVSINTYEPFVNGTSQYRWLENDLATVDRKQTPWVIVIGHDPIYYSNQQYSKYAEFPDARISMLQDHLGVLFHRYGVNMYLNGHVHAYERTKPIFQNTSNPCGTTYITAGDGGNYEGKNSNWLDKPEWSAFRSDIFGFGSISFANATHALFEWYGTNCQNATSKIPCAVNDDDEHSLLDSAWITREKLECLTTTPTPTTIEEGNSSAGHRHSRYFVLFVSVASLIVAGILIGKYLPKITARVNGSKRSTEGYNPI